MAKGVCGQNTFTTQGTSATFWMVGTPGPDLGQLKADAITDATNKANALFPPNCPTNCSTIVAYQMSFGPIGINRSQYSSAPTPKPAWNYVATVDVTVSWICQAPTPPPPPFSILGIEYTQATQYWNVPIGVGSESKSLDNTVPLVQNKATVLRVYIDGRNGGSVSGVMLFTAPQFIDSPPTNNPPAGRIAIIPAAAINRNQVDDTLNFLIPARYCVGTLIGGVLLTNDAGTPLVTGSAALTFVPGLELNLQIVQITTPSATLPIDSSPLTDYIQRAFPVSNLTSNFSTLTWQVEVDTIDEFAKVYAQLANLQATLINPTQTVVVVGIIQGTNGVNNGDGFGNNLTALFYAGDLATDGAHWVARSLGVAPVECDNPARSEMMSNVTVVLNSVQHVLSVKPPADVDPTVFPPEAVTIGTATSHTVNSVPQNGVAGQASTSFLLSYDPGSNTYRMDATVQCSSKGIYDPSGNPANADCYANAAVWPVSAYTGQMSFNVDLEQVVLNFAVSDNQQGLQAHGRFDLQIIRTDVNPFQEVAYWGVDPNQSANATNPNLPDVGGISLPPGSYYISLGVNVGTNTQDATPASPPNLSYYEENRIVSAEFQFISVGTAPTGSVSVNGKIPETGFDSTLLRTYPTTDFYDLMTQCSPRWVSPYTYTSLLTNGLGLVGKSVSGPVIVRVPIVPVRGKKRSAP